MIAFFAVFVSGHVPQYDGCDHNCCHPPHDPTTSQVAYLKGSGGVEYDLHELHGKPLDFDVVFKKDYDQSWYSIYAGCGGCASSMPFNWDEPLSPPRDLPTTYPLAEFEPFTQHAYYKLLPDGPARQITPAQLANCSSHHVSVRLVVHDNAAEDIVWGAVVGCDGLECERFTALELLSFPIYVIRNHGPVWNDAAWTLPVIAVLVPILMAIVCWIWWEGWLVVYVPVGPSYPRILAKARPDVRWADLKAVCWVRSLRLMLYALATWAIIVDLFETFVHFAIAARTAPASADGYSIFWFWYGIKWLLFFCVALPWMWAREIPESRWRDYGWKLVCAWDDGLGLFSPFWAHGFWSLAEIPLGLASLFIGAGFYVYPVCITLAGLVRLVNWARGRDRPKPECKSTLYIAPETDDTDCGYASSGGGGGGDPPGLYLS